MDKELASGDDEGAASQPPQDARISHAKDWAGDDDPANPRNFSLTRRLLSTIFTTFLAFVSAFAASIYSPSHPQVSAEFNVSDEVSILPLSLYNVGLAFGPLIGAPLSETYGRKAVFLTTTPIFALFVMGSGFSNGIVSLCVCRFFAGVFASPAISNASATILDFTSGPYRGVAFGFYYSLPTFGAVFGPLVGGFLVEDKGWRWTQWTTIFFIIAFYIPIIFAKESYKKTILQKRAKELGIEGPPSSQRTIAQSIRHFFTVLIARPLHMLCTETIVTLVSMYNGFLFGLMYTFVVASPWVFEHYYGFGLTGQSLSFLGLTIGALLAPLVLSLLDLYLYKPRLKAFRCQHSGEELFPPENRLFSAMIGSFLLPATLFVFAWTSRPSIHWICPIIFQCLSTLNSILIYASTSLFMVDAYGPLYGASAAGAAMFTRYGLSAAFPLFALQMYKALGVGWATSLLAFCTLAMASIPWLFWWYGDKIRARTKYETSS